MPILRTLTTRLVGFFLAGMAAQAGARARVGGRIVRIDNIGLMLQGVATLGFTH